MIPRWPEVPEAQRAVGTTRLRYEDVAQDGRLRIEGIWPPMGPLLWGSESFGRPMQRLANQGIRAVLAQVVMEGAEERIAVHPEAHHELCWRIGEQRDAAGALPRLTLETWLVTHAPPGAPYGQAPPRGAEPVLAARAWGLHVFTRPGAPKGEHRVLSLGDAALPAPAPASPPAIEPLALLEGDEPLEPGPSPASDSLVFGLAHTDGNQHVNFLAYPRLLEEAALRRLRALGVREPLLGRRAAVTYRRPSFAGEEARLVLQALRSRGGYAVVAAVVDGGDPPPARWGDLARPRCVLRLDLTGSLSP